MPLLAPDPSVLRRWTSSCPRYSALVMPGVTIGHGAVVADWSVVARDAPPYAVVAMRLTVPAL
jgi:hypothetical protein